MICIFCSFMGLDFLLGCLRFCTRSRVSVFFVLLLHQLQLFFVTHVLLVLVVICKLLFLIIVLGLFFFFDEFHLLSYFFDNLGHNCLLRFRSRIILGLLHVSLLGSNLHLLFVQAVLCIRQALFQNMPHLLRLLHNGFGVLGCSLLFYCLLFCMICIFCSFMGLDFFLGRLGLCWIT